MQFRRNRSAIGLRGPVVHRQTLAAKSASLDGSNEARKDHVTLQEDVELSPRRTNVDISGKEAIWRVVAFLVQHVAYVGVRITQKDCVGHRHLILY